MTRDARLSALHRGGFGLQGRASLTGICAGSVRASSSHPGRSAWRAGSRASRGKRLRAAAAGRHASLRIQDRLENTPSTSKAAHHLLSLRNVVNRKMRFGDISDLKSKRHRPVGSLNCDRLSELGRQPLARSRELVALDARADCLCKSSAKGSRCHFCGCCASELTCCR
jgi:hypothetical protein